MSERERGVVVLFARVIFGHVCVVENVLCFLCLC